MRIRVLIVLRAWASFQSLWGIVSMVLPELLTHSFKDSHLQSSLENTSIANEIDNTTANVEKPIEDSELQ